MNHGRRLYSLFGLLLCWWSHSWTTSLFLLHAVTLYPIVCHSQEQQHQHQHQQVEYEQYESTDHHQNDDHNNNDQDDHNHHDNNDMHTTENYHEYHQEELYQQDEAQQDQRQDEEHQQYQQLEQEQVPSQEQDFSPTNNQEEIHNDNQNDNQEQPHDDEEPQDVTMDNQNHQEQHDIHSEENVVDDEPLPRGVDYSWPAHYIYNRHPQPAERGRIGRRYLTFMQGCSLYYTEKDCQRSEHERLVMNLRQPRALQNYTSAGYAKIKAPTVVVDMLQQFYKSHNHRLVREQWPPGNIYTNHWSSTIKVLPIAGLAHDATQPSLTATQRLDIVRHVQPLLEAWCKMPLVATSLYGIREYRRGAILTPHVDRLPLVLSAIINVAQQDLQEPWPLELMDHSGMAINVTMEPGDMVLYEGASVIHGRPYPLNGQAYANLFLHFEPVGYSSERHTTTSLLQQQRQDPKTLFDQALEKRQASAMSAPSATDYNDDTTTSTTATTSRSQQKQQRPYYVPPQHTDAWAQNYVFVKTPSKPKSTTKTADENTIAANEYEEDGRLFHNLAAKGMLFRMKDMVKKDPSLVTKQDHNGWLALHEAARAGHTRVVEYLCGMMDQTEINTRTNNGKGGTPLWWALHMHDENHPVVKALIRNGAKSIPPNSA